MLEQKKKVIAIVGPTASGKSSLAVFLAKKLGTAPVRRKYDIEGAEIISADSRQVYKHLNIYAAKITEREMQGIPHHLLDIASPRRIFTVAEYQARTVRLIQKLHKERKLPLLCGGTGLYIDSVISGTQFPAVTPRPELRKELERKTAAELFAVLKEKDPVRAAEIDRHNPRRLIRALEIVLTTGRPVPRMQKTSVYDALKIGIALPQEHIKERIEERFTRILEDGSAIREVEELHRIHRVSWKDLERLGLGYRLIARFLRGELSMHELKEAVIKEEAAYVRRQMTWFKKDPAILWIDTPQKAFEAARDFLGREVPASPNR